jgi:hypothetical protein
MERDPPAAPPGLAPEDYYFEGPYLVFTAAYHLKRGTCCGSGCRHCPYKETKAEKPQENSAQLPPPED